MASFDCQFICQWKDVVLTLVQDKSELVILRGRTLTANTSGHRSQACP